ncbi:MAG: aspartate 1-decarboxylase [Actinomycetota bacterium]|nr:aspartate 1-decarboxylase [Actinomycetota bacterium]
MFREMLKSKIHRARVTQADLHYVGSLTIDAGLMRRANLLPGEKVDVVDIDNGSRLSTYVIEGPPDSGIIGINGAAARLVSTGDLVIIISYATVSAKQAATLRPRVVFVDEHNRPLTESSDHADVPEGFGLHRGDLPLLTGQQR